MRSGKALKLPPEKEPPEPGDTSPFPGFRLAQNPILLLIYFHKALRHELYELRRIAVAALDESQSQPCLAKDLVQEFLERVRFLRLVYKYHCTAEDEIVFLALDEHIKHVACTYSLEHDSIGSLFHSVSHCLDVLTEGNESGSNSKTFQELVFCIGTIQRSICQHMQKEEEEVFPLLMGQFSTEQQASLIWQFICSAPIVLLKEMLPWMISFLLPHEHIDVRTCMEGIVPKEKFLKEVVTSWLGSNNYQTSLSRFKIAKRAQHPDGYVNVKAVLKLDSSKSYSRGHWHWKEAYCSKMTALYKPIKGFLLCHGAMKEDLNHIQEELYQIRSSSNFMNLASVVVQLKFLAEVFFFYSDALEKVFYPVLNEVTNGLMSSHKQFLDKGQLEGLQLLLHHTSHSELASVKHVEKLCQEVDSLVIGVGKHFAFQETKVLPIMINNCGEELQKRLVYMSLQMLPLGLLQCTVAWFSAHLSEDESRNFLFTIKKEKATFNGSFSSLIKKWFLIGNCGKASLEKFRTLLQDMSKSSCSFLFKKNEEHIGSSSLYSSIPVQQSQKSNPTIMGTMFAKKGKNYLSPSSFSGSLTMSGTSYSKGLDQHIPFPATREKSFPLQNFLDEKTCASSVLNEPKPVDIIFYFHKALKKDLENLVCISAQLVENIGLLGDFSRRFQLIWFLYRIHTDTEDEIAFPALEAKGKAPNISLSYTMDHKLQGKYFDGISCIVDEMSELHASFSTADVNTLAPKILHHTQLCIKLHDMCKSMHKLLLDHVHHEDIELWPLFREDFSIEEQEKIVGSMLGRTSAKTLQDMIPWLMEALTPEEQHNIMLLWQEATRNTMFSEWLKEWWEGYGVTKEVDEPNPCPSQQTEEDQLDIISMYLSKGEALEDKGVDFPQNSSAATNTEPFGKGNADDKWLLNNDHHLDCNECTKLFSKNISSKVADITDHVNEPGEVNMKFNLHERLLTMSQEDLEATIQRISHDSSLDIKQKSILMQNLRTSRWIATQKRSYSESVVSSSEEEIPGQCPSYQDHLKVNLGCKHYKRNCKLLAACCNKLHTCIRCHDEVADHTLDRKSITKMMCMKCLVVQPIGPLCSTPSCNNLSMARYYCRICKIFQDERKEIYHCPYCNLCRVGKGLGIDYFHCMNCNACMSRSLFVHPCRKKSFEDNCPICHEFIFTSRDPVKSLPCGHMMHSKCFQAYTCNHYTCPICSKSLGDMQVYFSMLDALLAEEKMPEEYLGKTKAILCNDCEKRGTARYHWLHHKCSYCGSYNTRVL